jgi:predicted permease
MTVGISATKYPRPDQQQAFFDRLLQRVRSLPGVESAGVVDSLPLNGGGGSTQPIAIAGRPAALVAEQPEVAVRRISPGYLRALRIPLLRGRDLAATDTANQPAVVLVSASMARRFWPGEEAVGKRLTLSFVPQTSRLVVGVVGDVKQGGLDEREPVATLYRPLAQEPTSWLSLVVRTVPPPLGSVGAIESAIREIDPDQPAQDVLTMEDVLGRSLAQRRFNMLLLAAFAGLALILAAAGIYSVLAYSVRRRVREIGIRMALGAQLRDVLRLILVEGMKPALAGMALGLAAAVVFDRVVASLLYGVSATDPATFAAVSALLGGVALAACVIPAYRATRVEPMAPLREE